MNQECKPNFTVIEGGMNDMEHKLVELLFKPYLYSREEYLRQLAQLEPSPSRANLKLVSAEPKQ
jgi:hypothetical protein